MRGRDGRVQKEKNTKQHRSTKKPRTSKATTGRHAKEADRATHGDSDAKGADYSHATAVHGVGDKGLKS